MGHLPAMESLPQYLIDEIFTHFSEDIPRRVNLNSCLVVSRKFQLATERACGHFSSFILTESNTEKFLKIYAGHRRYLLKVVEFKTSAPPLPKIDPLNDDDDFPPCRDTIDDLQARDQSFSDQIHLLFATLKTLEDREDKDDPPRKINLIIVAPTRKVASEDYCAHHVYVSWRVHLLSPENLPELSSVNSCKLREGGSIELYSSQMEHAHSKLDLRILLDLAVKLPHLEYLRCDFRNSDLRLNRLSEALVHYSSDWEGPRRDTRHNFAQALQNLKPRLPSSLKFAELNFTGMDMKPDMINQLQLLPNLVKPALYDPFSTCLGLLSHQLRTLELQALVDQTLFWPVQSSGPFWPNLEGLRVKFHMAAPKGNWYFHGVNSDGIVTAGFEVTDASYPPLTTSETDKEWDLNENSMWPDPQCIQFRIIPDTAVLSPFLSALARAIARMPLLKTASIWCPLSFHPSDLSQFYEDYDPSEFVLLPEFPSYRGEDLAWGLIYAAPGESGFCAYPYEYRGKRRSASAISSSPQIWWKVGKWKPDHDLHQLFQQVGIESAGGNLIEHWEDEVYGQRLVGREVFEY